MNVWELVKSETMANALSRPARAPSESLPRAPMIILPCMLSHILLLKMIARQTLHHNGRVLRPPPRARPPLRPARAPHARSRAAARARAAPRARGRVAFVLSMLRKPSTTASSARCKVVTGGSALGRPMLQGRRTYPTDGFELQRTPATTPNSPATAHCRTRTYPCTLPSTCSSRSGVSSGVSGIGRRVSTRRTDPTAKHLPP